jgi:predicted nucleic acid-binding protein
VRTTVVLNDELVAAQAAATTGVIRLEVLRGSRSPQHFQLSSRSLDALAQLSSDDLWDEAACLGLQLRRLGVTAQSTDLLIAAVAIRAGATVLHRDRDFDAIARHTPLLVESPL